VRQRRKDDDGLARRFRELAWPHLAVVLRVARLLVGSAADAEDLAQETMLKALRAIDTLRDGADAKAWLLAILRNVRVDHLRRAGRSAGTLSLERLEVDPPASPEATETWERPEEILNAFSDAQVIRALQELPEEIRLTLLLVDVEQIDHREAAAMLEVPVGTIKSRTHRGRAMLRERLASVAREMGLVPRA